MFWRFTTFLLLLILWVVLRQAQLRPKCPHCAQRKGRDWYGEVGYCRTCGKAFTV